MMTTHYMFPSGIPGSQTYNNDGSSVRVGQCFHLSEAANGWTCTGARIYINPSVYGDLADPQLTVFINDDSELGVFDRSETITAAPGWNTVTWDTPFPIPNLESVFAVFYEFGSTGDYVTHSSIPAGSIVCPTNSLLVADPPGSTRSLYRYATPGTTSTASSGVLWGIDIIVEAPNEAPTVEVSSDLNPMRLTDTAVLTADATDEGSITLYQWEVVSGPSLDEAQFSDSTIAVTDFNPDSLGNYSIQCTVTDDQTETGSDALLLPVIVPTPLVLHMPQEDFATKEVPYQLDVTAEGGFGPKSYAWTVLSAPPATGSDFSNDSIRNPTITTEDVGNFVLRVTVTDTVDTETSDIHLAVRFPPPSPSTHYRYDGFIWIPQVFEAL